MARRPTRRRHSAADADINLIPVMNLFMVLIPFLLLSAVFAKTAVIDVYLPQMQQAERPSAPSPSEVLTVEATPEGFTLSGLGRGLPPVPKRDGEYDFAALSEALSAVKAKNPAGREAILLFATETPYELVIKTMDATRERVEQRGGRVEREPLFPLVSVGERPTKG